MTVGTGGTYPSLSGTGGLFDVLNGAVLTGNVVVNITSDLTETGGFTLNQWQEEGAGNYTLTIQPDSATMRTISGSVNAGLITLNGADRVTIDGRFGGSGRYLTFRNTDDTGFSGSTILFINDASSNTVLNCVVEGGVFSYTLGVIGFSTGTVTGNDNNLITGCQVRDLGPYPDVPAFLIGSTGSSAAVANSGNTVSNNELLNFQDSGIFINWTGNDSWTLSGNNISSLTATTFEKTGIVMEGGGTNVITGNSIHDLLSYSSSTYGIHFSGASTTTIARNRITALSVNVDTEKVYGIYASGSAGSALNVVNNQVTLSPSASVSRTLYGIYDIGSTDSVVNAFYNSIVISGTESGTRSSWASLRVRANTHTARNNLFLNLRTGGTGSHFAAGSEGTGGSYTVSHNVYAGTGATAANFMDFSGTAFTAVPVSFATWQSSTGDTNSQAGIAGSGDFTTAMFVDAANGDLHLTPGGNPLVNNTGTPIAGVTDDYDGNVRSASAPFIGSDELVLPNIVVSQTSALTDGISSVDLGAVNVSSSSAALTITITNTGTADLTGLAVSKEGTDAADFTVSALSSTSVAVGAGSATFTVTFTPGAGGTRTAAIHIASNVTGAKNPFDFALSGTGLMTQEMWRQTWFGTTANSGDAADTFDYDHDGLVNLVEFAFGLNPTQNSSNQLPAGQIIGGNFVISFTPPAGVSGITYGAEWSTTLTGTWNPITDTGTPPQHTFSVPIGTNTNLFVRLKVASP